MVHDQVRKCREVQAKNQLDFKNYHLTMVGAFHYYKSESISLRVIRCDFLSSHERLLLSILSLTF